MRVIAGIHRHRTILGPPARPGRGEVTRPILDRVKQALFDRLWAMGVFPEPSPDGLVVPNGNVVDIFSGTGSLGLEALSRGADHCTFIERDRAARRVLQQNLASLELTGQASVLGVEALAAGWVSLVGRRPVRVVFCDPPYPLMAEPETAARVIEMLSVVAATAGLVERDGALVLRLEEHVAPPTIAGWGAPTAHEYGSMKLALYRSQPGA